MVNVQEVLIPFLNVGAGIYLSDGVILMVFAPLDDLTENDVVNLAKDQVSEGISREAQGPCKQIGWQF